VIHGYDEGRVRAQAHHRSSDRAFSRGHALGARATAQILDRLTEEDLAAAQGRIARAALTRFENWLTIYASHGHDHAKQIRAFARSCVTGG